jgi:protein-tyrosine phosphatase
MIDVHFHCLPGIDDGPRHWDDAIELCRTAGRQGTRTIVATPHVLRSPWLNEDRAERSALVAKLNDLVGGEPAIVEGCEYSISSEVLDLIRLPEGPLVGLNGSRHLLIEFTTSALPRDVDFLFHELIVGGSVPVIAHPERHPVFAASPEKLKRLVDLGAKAQLTAGSILGDFGRDAEKASRKFLEADLIFVVASDAHNLTRRPPRLAAAYERLRATYGEATAEGLVLHHPRQLIAYEEASDA